MSTSAEIKKEINSLLEAEKQENLLSLPKESLPEFGRVYQNWYSRAYKVVESLAPERLEEFISYYRIDPMRTRIAQGNYVIQDFLKGARLNYHDEEAMQNLARMNVRNQIHILDSLSSRIDSVLQDVTGHLFAELQDAELTVATQLKKISKRAAGALAGVVLERHLQRAAQNHKITIRKRSPTISDLNDPLKNSGVYDMPTWRKIQLLADIRNLCAHEKKREPTDDEVDELISGVNSVIKSVF